MKSSRYCEAYINYEGWLVYDKAKKVGVEWLSNNFNSFELIHGIGGLQDAIQGF